MSERIITVADGLWLDMEGVEYDGLFRLRDGVGGEVLIDKDEVPALISALQQYFGEKEIHSWKD